MLSAMYAESHFLIIMLSIIVLDVGILSYCGLIINRGNLTVKVSLYITSIP
jgi:hypothetical protein